MNHAIRVFVGFDQRQPIAYHVLAHSILKRSSVPVSLMPLNLSYLPIKRRGLTEFTYSRFLAPWLCGYQGYSVFLDSDILCLGDISWLVAAAMADSICVGPASVWVAKNPLRFEWASVMVLNNEECKVLSPEFVEDGTNGLFDLAWATRVGDLPGEWNHLVGYDAPRADPKLIHYTQGLPIWPETRGCEHAEAWIREAREAGSSVDFAALMGPSVHAEVVLRKSPQGGPGLQPDQRAAPAPPEVVGP